MSYRKAMNWPLNSHHCDHLERFLGLVVVLFFKTIYLCEFFKTIYLCERERENELGRRGREKGRICFLLSKEPDAGLDPTVLGL